MAENEGTLLAGLETPAPPPAPSPAPTQEPSAAAPAQSPPVSAPTSPTVAQDDWRAKIAGDDKDFYKQLERFTDPSQLGKAYKSIHQKISSGELKAEKPFPDKGSPEEQAQWRKDKGIPDAPDLYLKGVALPNGIVPGEADKPGLERLAQRAAQKNWTQAQYNDALEAYYSEVEAVTAAREQFDDRYHQEAEETLRTEWGNDYRRNVGAVHNLLNGAPSDVRERLFGGRTADGKLIGDDPAVLKWLAQLSIDINPAATLVAGGSMDSFNTRLQQLEKMVGDAKSDYYTGANSKELRQEYLKLLEAQEKLRERGRAA